MRLRTALAVSAVLLAAACKREAPPEPVASETAPALPVSAPAPEPTASATASQAAPSPSPSPTPTPAPSPPRTSAALDTGALAERRHPERVLRFYAAALAARDWAAAARAWGAGSGVTATTLKASYDRADPPTLAFGKGDQEGAAGSLYYEAPVTLRFGAAPPERGSLVLRRVNDVDGATAEQLRWHIERSTIGQGQ